jgi:hypothetical protein
MKKPEFTGGPKAKENFERAMIALFQASKPKMKNKFKKKGKD